MKILLGLVMMWIGYSVTPYVAGYASHWTGTGEIGLVVMTTAWLWSVLYWGAVVHVKLSVKVFGD